MSFLLLQQPGLARNNGGRGEDFRIYLIDSIMPTRVTLRVKRSSPIVHERHPPIAKKQRTTHIPGIHNNVTDGSSPCDKSAGSESALCQTSYDPHILHKTSTRTSNQITSQVATADHGEISSFNSSIETSLKNESPPFTNGCTELPCEEELKYDDMAQNSQNSTGHGRAAIPLVLNKKQNKKIPSWDERFKELVDFKKINGHANAPTNTGPFGAWISNQRTHYRLLQEGKDSSLTIDRCEKLESIGFEFNYRATFFSSWNQRFQELVDFKKINGHTNKVNGHTNVPICSGQLGTWISNQRTHHRCLKEGKHSPLTIDRCEKLERIGFEFNYWAAKFSSWDQRFQELVDYKKINGHTIVPTRSGQLGTWISNQRTQYTLLQEGKDSLLTIEKCEKLESIGFEFKCRATYSAWNQRFQDLVDYKKINGHTNVPTHSGRLGSWITKQRTHYRYIKEGKDSPLTIDNREKLESIGFEFKCRPTCSPWNQRFQELVDFKKINGHTNVRTHSGPLGRWVGCQRRNYHLLKEGKHSPLTTDKSKKLESIGFDFRIGLVFIT
eukprot:scaffold15573_cov69-Attheya_sp.AAC.1